ncbi:MULTISPECIES: Fis family transcriptional regulator [Alteromonadaceae]|uniref:Fis family transcriptional regulator n=1 Tax=Alteromonadaceae TaxID=72275 RepID=UPI001C09CFC5|nr:MULTISPECIES: Fis family transcriptional regulator [Aliiglaciecola]MBU2876235.1 Fis family transcriptional regulator [Aliiglaciecola lipolytica]MDO6710451.1 Fis family transcriptional regulator [Aliiglaciecola sp. 2_MG-2023]MDO6751684.1 Fis family transcriptional regulator [Aliiglaciecola sp. 1_MG-2023]
MSSAKSTVKKLDENTVKALTKVCEEAKRTVQGFDWLTHTADYSNFPSSLVITCVFLTEQQVIDAKAQQQDAYLRKLIHKQLLKVGILLKNPKHNVFFDSEEACAMSHQGNWDKRLRLFH